MKMLDHAFHVWRLGLAGLTLALGTLPASAAEAEPPVQHGAPQIAPALERHIEIHRTVPAPSALEEGLMVFEGMAGPPPWAQAPPSSAPECVLRHLRPGLTDHQSDLIKEAGEALFEEDDD